MGVSVFVLRSFNWSIMKVLPCNRLDILEISDFFTHGVTASITDLLPAIALFQNCSVPSVLCTRAAIFQAKYDLDWFVKL